MFPVFLLVGLAAPAIGLLVAVLVLAALSLAALGFFRGEALQRLNEKLADGRERNSKLAAKFEKRGHTLCAKVFHALAAGSMEKLFEAIKSIHETLDNEKQFDLHMDEVFEFELSRRLNDEKERPGILTEIANWQRMQDAKDEAIAARVNAAKNGGSPVSSSPGSPSTSTLPAPVTVNVHQPPATPASAPAGATPAPHPAA